MDRQRREARLFNVCLLLVLLSPTVQKAPAGVSVHRFAVRGTVRAAEDGARLRRVKILALGTRIPPVFTDVLGRFKLELPSGKYTLRAAGGGCTEVRLIQVTMEGHDVIKNFKLYRKLDDSGRGCRPIAFKWVDAKHNTGLVGDEFSGRLRLPFAFHFYGRHYRQVFISDNGYLNFLKPDKFNSFPSAIPSEAPPNAAIYALWQDLRVGKGSSIDYQTVGKSPSRAFVIEYAKVFAFSAKDPVSFEVKLWQSGAIDILYGSNHANPGDGRSALIGIEDAEGTDALQFSFLERLLGSKESYRFERVPTGRVHGIVRDANDGEPIGQAFVSARPGVRMARTNEHGSYSLRLRPGSYKLLVSSGLYETGTKRIRIASGRTGNTDFLLKAPVADESPPAVRASVTFGQTTQTILTISNKGTSDLEWTAKERDRPPEQHHLLGGRPGVRRQPVWAPSKVPLHLPKVSAHPLEPVFLDTIIEDPPGDALGPVDVTRVRAGTDGATVATIAIDFTIGTPMDKPVGYVFLDTDQDASTGLPPEQLFGKPTQDIGVDYFADLFSIHDPDPVVSIIDASDFELVAAVPVGIEGQTVTFNVPLDAVGGDDGFIDTAMVLGDTNQATDWAPDEGHGTIDPFIDVSWMSESPDLGEVPPGQRRELLLTLGTPDLAPGEYHALLVLLTNAPKETALTVDVTLTVLPFASSSRPQP